MTKFEPKSTKPEHQDEHQASQGQQHGQRATRKGPRKDQKRTSGGPQNGSWMILRSLARDQKRVFFLIAWPFFQRQLFWKTRKLKHLRILVDLKKKAYANLKTRVRAPEEDFFFEYFQVFRNLLSRSCLLSHSCLLEILKQIC